GLDVVRAGVVLPQRAASRVKVQSQAVPRKAPAIQWQETGTRLEVVWDAGVDRYLSVTHQLGNVRTALALNVTGGRANLEVAALPRGGEYELSLSDGLNAQLIVVRR